MMSSLIRPNTVAIFGGTFDPPHLGHREAVRGLFLAGVKRVIVVPAAIPPLKNAMTDASHRLAMAQLCFDLPGFDVAIDPREIERARVSGQPSYSFETIRELSRESPRLAFVIGADQLLGLPKWHRYPEVLGLCDWIVLLRKPDGESIAREALNRLPSSAKITLLPTDAPAVSSTLIREAIARTGEPPAGVLLPAVTDYLKKHHLYGT